MKGVARGCGYGCDKSGTSGAKHGDMTAMAGKLMIPVKERVKKGRLEDKGRQTCEGDPFLAVGSTLWRTALTRSARRDARQACPAT